MPKNHPRLRRGQPLVMLILTMTALIMASTPMTAPALANWAHESKINSIEYKQQYGLWETIDLPEEYRLNTIHGATLPTGKVLLIAGSGNNRENFNKFHNENEIKVLKTVVLDPETMHVKVVETPADLFCGGHALLQSGSLLVAGGTSGYELLDGAVTKPAGTMLIHNENPDDKERTIKKGTRFISPAGKAYVTTEEVKLQPAMKHDMGGGDVTIHHSSTKVFVEAVEADQSYINEKNDHYKIEGLKGIEAQNIYGQGGPMTLNKQDFRGDDASFEFDPIREEYVKTGDLNESRWYPTLPVLQNGDVLAVSGLDNTGVITETTERYNPQTKTWAFDHNRAFPTYPALHATQEADVLFYSGANAGYGPEDKGREPGFWNVRENSFQPVGGLRDANILETAGSVFLPPTAGSNDGSQSWRVMVAGGGGIGESILSTNRTDTIDLAQQNPTFTPSVNLPEAIRYPNMTVTPWDQIFVNGGSRDYRAKGNSYSHKSYFIDPTTNNILPMADEPVGRSYHSGSLLLRDGRILVFGNDPLYGDKKNTTAGTFEQRLEIYTPPQFFRGERPSLTGKSGQQIGRGDVLTYKSEDAATIKTARLIPPSSATHVTNIEQRSIAAVVKTDGDKVTVSLPSDKAVMPNGWYMLFTVNDKGIPSVAKMVHVVR